MVRPMIIFKGQKLKREWVLIGICRKYKIISNLQLKKSSLGLPLILLYVFFLVIIFEVLNIEKSDIKANDDNFSDIRPLRFCFDKSFFKKILRKFSKKNCKSDKRLSSYFGILLSASSYFLK